MLEIIKRLCAQRSITIRQLESSAGITERAIYRWDENTPSVDKVKRVADVLGVTVDDLLKEDKEHEC